MNFKFILFVAATLLVGVGVATYATQTQASAGTVGRTDRVSDVSRVAKEAQEILQQTINAVKEQDLTGFIKHTYDLRYENQSDRLKSSVQILDETREIRMGYVRVVDSSLVVIETEFTDDQGRTQILNLPIYKRNGQWKVIIGGSSHPGYKYDAN